MALNNKFNQNSTNLNEVHIKLELDKNQYDFLLLGYKNKYVAVRDENVIVSDSVFLNLIKRVECNFRNSWKSIAILLINKEHKILNPFLR